MVPDRRLLRHTARRCRASRPETCTSTRSTTWTGATRALPRASGVSARGASLRSRWQPRRQTRRRAAALVRARAGLRHHAALAAQRAGRPGGSGVPQGPRPPGPADDGGAAATKPDAAVPAGPGRALAGLALPVGRPQLRRGRRLVRRDRAARRIYRRRAGRRLGQGRRGGRRDGRDAGRAPCLRPARPDPVDRARAVGLVGVLRSDRAARHARLRRGGSRSTYRLAVACRAPTSAARRATTPPCRSSRKGPAPPWAWAPGRGPRRPWPWSRGRCWCSTATVWSRATVASCTKASPSWPHSSRGSPHGGVSRGSCVPDWPS